MGLCHLAFADDLLLFCKGDKSSVKVLMRAFITFSEALGLTMNNEKSEIYMNGVSPLEAEAILQLSGFRWVISLSSTLGYPSRIRSYPMLNLHSYWARIFFLPMGVISRVNAVCRNYLWSGTDDYHKVSAVAWDA
ncbi:uncharacterized protein LOC141651946 [Silene latifolia]|uniref:uncharacterized protein LOC141651946 n=1 Tax=Silene latifolia TaxID=37657 RepID=UPI003D783B9B